MSPANTFDHESFLKSLTRKPGVYQMIDEQDGVLYVGKARNLKNRVTSYFRAAGLAAKTMAMVAKIARIEVTVTQSETEALLLEQSLIKELRPPYNVVLRDDKSYPFIHLTGHDDFPRLAFHRGAKSKKGRYFGPFPSAYAVRDSINILQRLFQLRHCDDSYFKNRSRPCLQYQIKRCSAPCVGLIDASDYREDVDLAVLFLEGKSQAVLDVFKRKMAQAAAAFEYEKAARYRDQIAHLTKVQESQYVHGEAGDVDVFALAQASGAYCVQGMFIRQGRLLGQRAFYPKNEIDLEDGELLEAFVSQFYLAAASRDIPGTLILSHELPEGEVLGRALTERAGKKVVLRHDVRTERARWLRLALENAQLSVQGYVADRRNIFARFVDLQEQLGMDGMPARLECFDISHTMGEATVASCVVFDTNGPLKSDYRRFNIEGITPGDDYAAMEQALTRRYQRIKKGEGLFPDLLVIDGGPGQLGKAKQVMRELQLEDLPILGIAKGPDRRAGLERFFLGDDEVSIDGQSAGAHLLQHIRDEAHRFAITGHRQRRAKKRTQSELTDIPGVGATRRRELLTHFGGLKAVKGASKEELAKVPGISDKLADTIYSALHQ
ncbi:MAG: excinuclease ABC subunit UvrC [Pseudomonadota bacterium]